jgi:hypothetical protein
MLSKNYWANALSLFFSFILLISGPKVNADMIMPQANASAQISGNYQGMWGTGYSGGVQACNTNWQQGSGAISISDEEQEERKRIQEAKAELDKMKLTELQAQAQHLGISIVNEDSGKGKGRGHKKIKTMTQLKSEIKLKQNEPQLRLKKGTEKPLTPEFEFVENSYSNKNKK